MGRQALALLRQLQAACTSTEELADATIAQFAKHPDAELITSHPGLGYSPAPASLANSATTAPASPTPAQSRPTPARHPSPAPAARAARSCTGASRTSAWPPPAMSGPSPP